MSSSSSQPRLALLLTRRRARFGSTGPCPGPQLRRLVIGRTLRRVAGREQPERRQHGARDPDRFG